MFFSKKSLIIITLGFGVSEIFWTDIVAIFLKLHQHPSKLVPEFVSQWVLSRSSWSPGGVLSAATKDANYLQEGKVKKNK